MERSCDRVSGWLVDRAYGELAGEESRLEAHLATCADCRERASRLSELFRIGGPGARMFGGLVSPEIRAKALEARWERGARGAISGIGRWILAFALALVSWLGLTTWPALGGLGVGLSSAHFLAWLGVYCALLDRIASCCAGASRPVVALRSRAVIYGVLASVVLFIASLGAFLAWDSLSNQFWARHLTSGLSHLVALLLSSALLVVGLIMGISLGRESSLNMVVVLVLYASIMFPVLMHGSAVLLRPDDLRFGLFLVVLWGLSGAHLGTVLAEPGRRHTTA